MLVTLLQFNELTPFVFCCTAQPVEDETQDTITVLVGDKEIESAGGGMVNRYAAPADVPPPKVSFCAPISTRSLPIVAKEVPNQLPATNVAKSRIFLPT